MLQSIYKGFFFASITNIVTEVISVALGVIPCVRKKDECIR